MEFSLINVNLNIDRKLFVFMCTGLMLTVVLSDESNPVANVLRAIPPISILDRYLIPVIKTAFGYFRGYGNLYGSIGAKVPIHADSFVPDGMKTPGGGESRGGDADADAQAGRPAKADDDDVVADGSVDTRKSSGSSLRDEGLFMDEEEALSIYSSSQGRGGDYYDEEAMPKSQMEMSKEKMEDAHEATKYKDNKNSYKKKKKYSP